MNRLGLALACGLWAAGTVAAQGQEIGPVNKTAGTTVTYTAGTFLSQTLPPDFSFGEGKGTHSQETSGTGYDSYVNVGEHEISWKSSNVVSGPYVGTVSSSEVAFDFTNSGNAPVNFQSTIIPAGLGFYLTDTSGGCLYDGCSPLSPATDFSFNGLRPQGVDGPGLLGVVGFDFEIFNNEHSEYHVSGALGLYWNGDTVIPLNALGPAGELLDIEVAANNGTTLGYAWDAKDVNFLLGGGYNSLLYRTTVYSFTNTQCLSRSENICLVGYSGFGDPIGRGGGVEQIDAFGVNRPFADGGPPTFSPIRFQLPTYDADTNTLSFTATVPEPATWVSLILGFGLLGAALRRRRAMAFA